MTRQPTIFLPHGGGPCFFMAPPSDDPRRWVRLEAYLRGLPAMLPQRPDALVVISAHWENPLPLVLAAPRPSLLFDYFGFPPETYRLSYPAPGAPELADRIRWMLADDGIDSGFEQARGFDHGVFVPLLLAFPDADIPIVQLSLQTGLDPERHLRMGRALSGLRDQNVLILGSGMSFHNLAAFADSALDGVSAAFDDWLRLALCDAPPATRWEQLKSWGQAPGARRCHPRAEHLLPLMVAAGAAEGEPGRQAFAGRVWGKAVSAFHFGG